MVIVLANVLNPFPSNFHLIVVQVHPFTKKSATEEVDVASWVCKTMGLRKLGTRKSVNSAH